MKKQKPIVTTPTLKLNKKNDFVNKTHCLKFCSKVLKKFFPNLKDGTKIKLKLYPKDHSEGIPMRVRCYEEKSINLQGATRITKHIRWTRSIKNAPQGELFGHVSEWAFDKVTNAITNDDPKMFTRHVYAKTGIFK